jgi:hypothetical protein
MDGPPSTPSPLWHPFCTSLAGTAHRHRGTPCQDASAMRRLGAHGEIVLMALSDGAGSASHSDIGAQTVVSHWLDAFTTLLHQCPDPDAVLAESGATTLHTMLTNIRNSVERDALAFEVSPSDFSATLLGAVLTPSGASGCAGGRRCLGGMRERDSWLSYVADRRRVCRTNRVCHLRIRPARAANGSPFQPTLCAGGVHRRTGTPAFGLSNTTPCSGFFQTRAPGTQGLASNLWRASGGIPRISSGLRKDRRRQIHRNGSQRPC